VRTIKFIYDKLAIDNEDKMVRLIRVLNPLSFWAGHWTTPLKKYKPTYMEEKQIKASLVPFLKLNIWRETRTALRWQVWRQIYLNKILGGKRGRPRDGKFGAIFKFKFLAGKEEDLKTSSALGRCSTCWDSPLFIIIIFLASAGPLTHRSHRKQTSIYVFPKKDLVKPHVQIRMN
jgi:hypothetical protein